MPYDPQRAQRGKCSFAFGPHPSCPGVPPGYSFPVGLGDPMDAGIPTLSFCMQGQRLTARLSLQTPRTIFNRRECPSGLGRTKDFFACWPSLCFLQVAGAEGEAEEEVAPLCPRSTNGSNWARNEPEEAEARDVGSNWARARCSQRQFHTASLPKTWIQEITNALLHSRQPTSKYVVNPCWATPGSSQGFLLVSPAFATPRTKVHRVCRQAPSSPPEVRPSEHGLRSSGCG